MLVLAVLVVATSLPAWAANPEEDRIAQTRAELQAVRAELEEAREEADDQQVVLADADRQLNAAFDAVEAASQAVGRQQDAVRDAEVRLAEARSELRSQRELMGERVARLYRQVRPDPLIQVLHATTVTEAVQQSAYMSAIGRQDRVAVESLANAETTVTAEEQALTAEEVSLGRVLEEQQAVLAEVEEMREDQALVAAASDDLVARLQSREDHLESESAQLAALARQREAAEAAAAAAAAEAAAAATRQTNVSAPAGEAPADSGSSSGSDGGSSGGGEAAPAPPPASGGTFSWPTSGAVTSGFGPRWGRQHEGIDIANGSGTAVAASRGGTVIQAGTLGGYGNIVLIAHGGGFVTAYAHLESIAVSNGQSVSTGTYLGGMGCSGSCTGTHLHFEIRANGTPVDPMGYL
ncbi:MAG TPA: peptidoglycan DD-metalloendopeptidase family protein [Euzebya sp.]|nr:peptidoglycan DD-metalloendopeptidase family protein [Euzebya sp.]